VSSPYKRWFFLDTNKVVIIVCSYNVGGNINNRPWSDSLPKGYTIPITTNLCVSRLVNCQIIICVFKRALPQQQRRQIFEVYQMSRQHIKCKSVRKIAKIDLKQCKHYTSWIPGFVETTYSANHTSSCSWYLCAQNVQWSHSLGWDSVLNTGKILKSQEV
jgi:hypothetical protein